MFEFITRCCLSVALLGGAWLLGGDRLEAIWRVVALFAAYSTVAFLMERRGLRNSGVSGWVGVLDAWTIASLLSLTGLLGQYGFAVVIPMVWAVARHGSDPVSMAPLAVASLLVCANLWNGGGWNLDLFAHSLAVLVLGLIAQPAQKVVIQRAPAIDPTQLPPLGQETTSAYLELRENFRALRDHSREVEKRAKRDRVAMLLFEASDSRDGFYPSVAKALAEVTGADGLSVYSVAHSGDRLIVESAQGAVPEAVRTSAFDLHRFAGEAQIRSRVEQNLSALVDPEQPLQSAAVMVKDKGRIVGMVCLFSANTSRMAESLQAMEDAADPLAILIQRQRDRSEIERRLREAELLYFVSGISLGAETTTNLCSRVVRELWESMRLDHLGIFIADGPDVLSAASQGIPARILESVTYGDQVGYEGWIAAGAPETYIPDAYGDPRLPKKDAIKKRVGSFALVPLQFGLEPYGYLSAATHRVGGIDLSQLETLRVVSQELSQALARLESGHHEPGGLATPKEFHQAVQDSESGCLVYLEVLRREEIIENYGRPAYDLAVRKFAARVRTTLPPEGMICRRAEGDFVALLRRSTEEQARSWANDASATASLVGIGTPDGKARAPLALRAKVSAIPKHLYEISSGVGS